MRLLGLAVVVVLVGFGTSVAEAETIYLTATRLLDPVLGREVDYPAIVIDSGKVTAIGTVSSLPAPDGARHIDLGAQTILPGLIDMLVHLTSRADTHGFKGLLVTPAAAGISGVANARVTLLAGFTTVRNVGASDYADVALRESIENGETIGPKLFVSGPLIGATGGHCDRNLLPFEYHLVSEGVADGPEAMRHKVREVHKYGADLIKLCATGGVLSKGDSVGAQQLTLAEMTAAVDEAHMLGLKVAAHAHGTSGIKDALRAGVDTIEHASLADDEAFALARQKGAAFSMDIYNDDFILGEGAKFGMLPESLEKERQVGRLQRETFRRAVKAGVFMIFGTDAGVYPHGDNARQFAKMVEWGMTPMQAIQAATVNAAKMLGPLGDDRGSLAPGKSADIIAVTADPLADIRTLENVAFVMRHGVVYKADGASVFPR